MLHATTVAIQVTLSIIDLRQVKLVLAPFRSSIVWHKIKLKKRADQQQLGAIGYLFNSKCDEKRIFDKKYTKV